MMHDDKSLRIIAFGAALALGLATLATAQDKKEEPAPAPPPAAAAALPSAPMVNDIKIYFDDKAKNDGQLLFHFTPEGGTAKEIRVTIAKKMGASEVAKDAEKELKVALGEAFKVDRYDPDKIKIEGKNKAKFSMTIASLTANGLSVRLK
ncbi:MAG TPA: hypothetical protein VFV19_05915 [Candidatus Polarisedimenticolaceae bacterium]|nr:hypothetical protein [Candidatus Polarisedimenticolaceae bacterium]